MKRKIIGICICMLVIATALPAVGTTNNDIEKKVASFFPPGVEWEYTYGGGEFDWFYDIIPTSDGGYVATGLSEIDNMFYAWLLKISSDGSEEWSVINNDFYGYDIDYDILVNCVIETPDNGYLVGGMGEYYNNYYSTWFAAGYLWKVDVLGVTEWLKPIVNETEPWFLAPQDCKSFDETGLMYAGYYVGYYSPSPADYYLDVALFKTDFDGNLLWYQNYDFGHDWETARSLDKTTDDGYYMAGASLDAPFSNNGGYIMIKTDSDGVIEKQKMFETPGFDYGSAKGCHQTADGGYIISGITDYYGAGGTDLWIIKTDEDFNEKWNKTSGGPNNERCYGMDATEDGGFVFVVIKNASYVGGTKDDTWIINMDGQGNLEWELLIEESGVQWSQSIVQTDDGGFIVAGRTGTIPSPDSDGLIIKIGPFPHFVVDIKGGLGVIAAITNDGLGDAIGVPWEIRVTGGILGMINVTKTGTIDLLAGETQSISTGLFFGLGSITITVEVGVIEETAEGTQLIILSMVK